MQERRSFLSRYRARHSVLALILSLLVGVPAPAAVTELVLGIAPLVGETATRQQFTPLCRVLAHAANLPCRIETRPNFFGYWETMRRGGDYNLFLDEAHFTDYRIQKMGYVVLAKIPGTITYSLVVPQSISINDPSRLVGRRIATLGIPSMGAALLNGLFPKPSKQPILVEVDTADEGFAMLRGDKVSAAILPTPLVRERIMQGAPLHVLLSTEPLPNMGLSAAPDIEPPLRETLRRALLDAQKSTEGRAMLRAIGIERFDPASATIYKGQARILQQYWGY
jgi:ABC transporter, phosphonate, periplasmic substrate-binding protein